MYTTKHIQTLFQLSHQTVRNYAVEFAAYLSPTATPEKNRTRIFTEADLEVLSLIVEMGRAGAVFESIHAALRTGQRGTLPDRGTLVIHEGGQTAVLVLRQQVMELQAELEARKLAAAEKDGQIKLLERLLEAAQANVIRLERENARWDDHR